MKPTTKLEKRVAELSATLPPLRDIDSEWMQEDFRKTYKRKGLCYYLILERCREFQVIRYYYISRLRFFEFMQVWLTADHHQVVLAKRRFMRVDGWKQDSEMTVWRQQQYIEYSYLGGIGRLGWSGCRIRSLIPELRQRGLRTSNHGINPVRLCKALLADSRLETLFKVRQYLLVHRFSQSCYELTTPLWQSIRVALRHGYRWDNEKELRDWCDMINDLSYLGLDIRNPHYICPANLAEAHQYWIERANKVREARRLEEEKAEVLAYEPIFYDNRKQFFGMLFRDKKLEISIIPTAMGIKEEGKAMHHCVGGYYNQLNSLILSAKINGKRIETIEVDLTDYHLVQSRGLQNKSTRYHKRIESLINANMDEIRKRNIKAA